MGVLTASGGACDIIADRAAAHGIEIPPFAAATAAAIAPHVPPFAQVRNPLDVTGYFLANQRTSALTAIDHALDAAVHDPGLDFVFFSGLTLPDVKPADDDARQHARGAGRLDRPADGVVADPGHPGRLDLRGRDTEFGRDLLGRNGIHLLGGMDLGVQAIGNALRWAEGRGRTWPGPADPAAAGPSRPGDRDRDRAARWAVAGGRRAELLTSFGVPLVPGELAELGRGGGSRGAGSSDTRSRCGSARRRSPTSPTSAEWRSACAPSRSCGPGTSECGAAAAKPCRCRAQRTAPGSTASWSARCAPAESSCWPGSASIPRSGRCSPSAWAASGSRCSATSALRVLPVGADEVIAMLGELRGAPLLRGARGGSAADLDALAGIIVRIADAALSLGDSLRSLEVNPLWVDGDQIEALDVLVVTAGTATRGTPKRTTARNEQNGHRDDEARLQHGAAGAAGVGPAFPRGPDAAAAGSRADGLRRRHDEKVWTYAGSQLGLQGIAIPEQYGGAGFTFIEQAIVLEELGAALYPGPYLASAVLAATALLASSDDDAKRTCCPGIASGDTVATLAFTEDNGSWEPDAIGLAASERDGELGLDGHKSFVLDGHTAPLILVVARAERRPVPVRASRPAPTA